MVFHFLDASGRETGPGRSNKKGVLNIMTKQEKAKRANEAKATTKKWGLEDAEEIAQLYPATFEIPERSERESLRVGDFARLAFSARGCVPERMWVDVTQLRSDGSCCGRLRNQPVGEIGAFIELNDEVSFAANNVINIQRF